MEQLEGGGEKRRSIFLVMPHPRPALQGQAAFGTYASKAKSDRMPKPAPVWPKAKARDEGSKRIAMTSHQVVPQRHPPNGHLKSAADVTALLRALRASGCVAAEVSGLELVKGEPERAWASSSPGAPA